MAEIKYIKGVCESCSLWMTAGSSNLPISCENHYLHGQWQNTVLLLAIPSKSFPQNPHHFLMEDPTFPEHFTWQIKPIKILLVGWPVSFFYKLFLLTLSPKDLLFYLFIFFVLVWFFSQVFKTECLGSPLTLHAIWISHVGYPKDCSAKSGAFLNLLCDFSNSEQNTLRCKRENTMDKENLLLVQLCPFW